MEIMFEKSSVFQGKMSTLISVIEHLQALSPNNFKSLE